MRNNFFWVLEKLFCAFSISFRVKTTLILIWNMKYLLNTYNRILTILFFLKLNYFFYAILRISIFLSNKHKSLTILNILNLFWTHTLKPIYHTLRHISYKIVSFTHSNYNLGILVLVFLFLNKITKSNWRKVSIEYFWILHFAGFGVDYNNV